MNHGAWFNLFLPLLYNNRRPVEPGRFDQTERELIDQFGGLTVFEEPTFLNQGFWRSRGRLIDDQVRIYAVFSEDINTARAYLTTMKPRWKRRFRQEAVFIVEIGVELL